jgi:hypothetical protein
MKKVLLLGAMLIAAAPVNAQTCVGIPIKPGALAIGAGVAFPEAAKSYHVSVMNNTTGKLFWNATGGITHLDDVDTNQKDISAAIGFKTGVLAPVSVCPRVAAAYSWWKYQADGAAVDLKLTTGMLGAGVGYEIPHSSDVVIGLFATPSLMLVHSSASITGTGYFDGSDSDNQTAFASDVGVTLGLSRAFVTGYASFNSLQDSKTVFGVNVALVVK